MKKILALFFILASALDARAGLALSRSLEWLADTSQSIGVYTATTATPTARDNHVYYSLGLKLKDSLKGKPPANVQYAGYYYLTKGKGVAAGDQFLVFLRSDPDAPLRPVQIISLAHPGGVLDTPFELAMNAKFEPLTDGDAILRTVRDRMAAHPGTVPAKDDWAMVEISRTRAFQGIELGDGYELLVPADLKAREELKEIVRALQVYYRINHAMPAGGPAEIVKELTTSHDSRVKYLEPDFVKARRNAAGEFLDPWGTPYRIDASNPKFPWAYSCGPDKKDDAGAPGSDDIVSW